MEKKQHGPATSHFGEMPKASRPIAEHPQAVLSRPVARPLSAWLPPKGRFGVMGAFDVTGSTGGNHPIINDAETGLRSILSANEQLADLVEYCSVKMTDGVHFTEYLPIREFKPVHVTPYGSSPHCELLRTVQRKCAEHMASCRARGLSLLGEVILFQADGGSSDGPTGPAIAEFREFQQKNNVYVFPIRIPPVDEDFIKAVSVHKQPADFVGAGIQELFDNLTTLLQAAVKDPSVLGRTQSMSTAHMPKANLGG